MKQNVLRHKGTRLRNVPEQISIEKYYNNNITIDNINSHGTATAQKYNSKNTVLTKLTKASMKSTEKGKPSKGTKTVT